MAKISIEPSKAKRVLGQQDSLERTLKTLSQDVDDVRSGLRYKIAGQEQISQRLREAAEQITKESQSTLALRSGLEEIIALYEQSEGKNRDQLAVEKTSVQQGGTAAQTQGTEDSDSHEAAWWEKLIDFILPKTNSDKHSGKLDNSLLQMLPFLIGGSTPFQYYDWETKRTGVSGSWDIGTAWKDKSVFKTFDDFKKNNQTTLKDRKLYVDPKTKMMTLVDPNDQQAMEEFKKHNGKFPVPVDVTLLGTGTAGSLSVYKNQEFLDGEWGLLKNDGSVSFSELEGHASAYIGLMGIGAAAGASYTAFSVEDTLAFGTDDLQLYGKVGVDVGRAGVNGSVGAGLIDGAGMLNPNLHANLSAELIAGEISGSIGGKVAGTDVSVKGSVNYGLGAHANIGYEDGKFSLDIGATVGVGGSVKIDIDVSGTVNTVAQGVGNIISGTGELLEGAGDFFSGIGEGIGNIFSR